MNLIADNKHMVVDTNASHPFKPVPGPHPAHRIVRAAEYNQLVLRLSCHLFQKLIINLISAVDIDQRASHFLPIIPADCKGKWIINRCQQNHTVAWLRIGQHSLMKGINDSRRGNQPFPLCLPPIAPPCPGFNSLIKTVRTTRIPQYRLVQIRLKAL